MKQDVPVELAPADLAEEFWGVAAGIGVELASLGALPDLERTDLAEPQVRGQARGGFSARRIPGGVVVG